MHFQRRDPSFFSRARLERLCFEGEEGFPLYVYPEIPFWFVPSEAGHRLLSRLKERGEREERADLFEGGCPVTASRFLRAAVPPEVPPYTGRAHLALRGLRELWIHLTDGCNLACRHCLFACRPGKAPRLEARTVERVVDEARELGCRLVCFTGGEPFVYPGFIELMETLQARPGLRIAVLTNGTLLSGNVEALARLDRERLHFQVSLDGTEANHDRIRGEGSFARAAEGLRMLAGAGIPAGTVMAVHEGNAHDMAGFVRVSREIGADTVHFMWHFPRGSGEGMGVPPVEMLIEGFREAAAEARRQGVAVDNLEALRAQVFTHPGTRFDFSPAGWESLAVGPDGAVYPSPAMVGLRHVTAGRVSEGLERVWRESPVLERIRSATLLDLPGAAAHPWRLVLGGGDLDHCLHNPEKADPSGLLGEDPYLPLYAAMVRDLVREEAARFPDPPGPGFVLRMGDLATACPAEAEVNFVHSNCLLSVGTGETRELVRAFYHRAAETPSEEILNPASYGAEELDFIPGEGRVRMYGCGSPVADTGLSPGEVLVDLGCGAGVECFLAARRVGPEGRVLGVDMTGTMLEIAERSRVKVARALGFDNTAFLQGVLEDLPLAGGIADAVISNCVINLCKNKRRTFREILRVLKPGGRLVISDVVCETEPPLAVRADHKLTGECIGGAMVQAYLFAMLADLGFEGVRILRRFPYRTVKDHPFFSLTFTAYRPVEERPRPVELLYGGPFRAVMFEDGTVIEKGARMSAVPGAGIDAEALAALGVHVLDPATGAVTNGEAGEASCCCASVPEEPAPPEPSAACCAPSAPQPGESTRPCCRPDPSGLEPSASGPASAPRVGCLVCGASLVYLDRPVEKTCAQCGRTFSTSSSCEAGHFVCDACHGGDPLAVVRAVCLATKARALFPIAEEIRSHPVFSLHGPEHHGIVPGVILTAFRNEGGAVEDFQILAAIERGAVIPGGACAFMGTCGAATGVGAAFAVVLGANPLRGGPRRVAMEVTARVLERLAEREAPRCCRRETLLSLEAAAALSAEYLPLRLRTGPRPVCGQSRENAECLGARCPFHPGRDRARSTAGMPGTPEGGIG